MFYYMWYVILYVIWYLLEMATYSRTLAWKIPWTKKPGRLQSMGPQRGRHDWETSLTSLYNHNRTTSITAMRPLIICFKTCITLFIVLHFTALHRYRTSTNWRSMATLCWASLLAQFFQQHLLPSCPWNTAW